MKIKLITNASKLLLTLVAGLFVGCAATRPISDVRSARAVHISVTNFPTAIPSSPPPARQAESS